MAIAKQSYPEVKGIALMCVAMLSIPLVDGIAKHLSGSYSPLYISWVRYAVASLLILPLGLKLFGKSVFPSENLGSHVLRTVFLVTAMTLFFVSVSVTPLATAMSAYFVGPIIASLLAVRFLGESMTMTKLIALSLGFIGAIVVMRPGGSMEPGILLALGAGVSFACYIVSTRSASKNTSPVKTLVFQCLLGALLLLPQAVFAWSVPQIEDAPFFLAMGALSVLSHFLSIAAFRYAQASTLAPLVYLELLSAAAIGYVFFKEVPELHVWIGAAIIVASGLMLLKKT
ncbi:MAG: EamA family transporter [Granulosicoccaceae bacterium]